MSTLYLRRTKHRDQNDRLDFILKKKASQNVRVFILLWVRIPPRKPTYTHIFQAETKVAMNNYSEYNKKYLETLHENISVIKHPAISPMKWSHHQKFVVVDNVVAFVGGIDLAYEILFIFG